MIKNIFFDFDGVIADSVNIKTEAFEQMYLPYGNKIAGKVVKHHKENGGMSRFEKFTLYHKELLGIDLNKYEINNLSKKFSSLVKVGVINAPEVNGSHKFLNEFKNKLNMFIITGTPTDESIEICKSRGIFDCFKGIYGSPQKKGYWSSYLLEKYNLKKSETIFVGDAMADYKASIENNLVFYLREYTENIELFKDIRNIIRFIDFEDFRLKM